MRRLNIKVKVTQERLWEDFFLLVKLGHDVISWYGS
jgi:hypothetical protein